MKRPLLKAEDGAKFYGSVTEISRGLFRAHCYAQLDSGDRVLTESPDYEMCRSWDDCIEWVESTGVKRGFPLGRIFVNQI